MPRSMIDAAPLSVYVRHFGLRADPFSLTPGSAVFYSSPIHAEAVATLQVALLERRGITLMTGEVGTGKTTILHTVMADLPQGIHTACVSNTKLPFDDILRLALADFGVAPKGAGRFDLLTALNQHLMRCAAAGTTAALIVDEAQNLDGESFEQMRLLSNFETSTEKLLQIVLVGQLELEQQLRRPELRQIADRVAVHCRLAPLDAMESRAYIDHRILRAGGRPCLFTPEARNLIIRAANGIPRRLNVLCHNALLFAYGHNVSEVTRPIAALAVRQGEMLARPARPRAAAPRVLLRDANWPRRWALAIAAGLLLGVGATFGALQWDRSPRPSDAAPPVSEVPSRVTADVRAIERGGAGRLDADTVHSAQPGPIPAPDTSAAPEVVAAAPSRLEPEQGSVGADEPAPVASIDAAIPSTAGEEDESDAREASVDAAIPSTTDASPPESELSVQIAPGATLESLAREYYGSVSAEVIARIRAANPQVRNPNHIEAGDRLRLPAQAAGNPLRDARDDGR